MCELLFEKNLHVFESSNERHDGHSYFAPHTETSVVLTNNFAYFKRKKIYNRTVIIIFESEKRDV